MSSYSNPADYWESRLQNQFDLSGVGYAILGPNYNKVMYQQRLTVLEKSLQQMNVDFTGKSVLEIGCGTGFYTHFCVEKHVHEYVGLDITDASVSALQKQYPDYRFFQADITAEVFHLDETFDVVIIADVIFHIVDDHLFETAVKNMAGYLNEGGLLILSDAFPRETTQTAVHVRNRSPKDYQTVFEKYNLAQDHIQPIFAVLHPPISTQGMSSFWRIYAWLWRYGWRIARIPFVDKTLPHILAGFDTRFALKHWGENAPNNKWLLATKHHVA